MRTEYRKSNHDNGLNEIRNTSSYNTDKNITNDDNHILLIIERMLRTGRRTIIVARMLRPQEASNHKARKPPATQGATSPKSQEARKPRRQEANKPKSQEAKKPKNQESRKPKSQETNKPPSQKAKNPAPARGSNILSFC